MASERIAIVGLGGLFPSAGDGPNKGTGPDRLWGQVLRRLDAVRDVPPGRWLLSPEEAFDPEPGKADRVYSRRGCFLDDIPLDPTGLDLPPGLLDALDPLFRLTLRAGREAFASAKTGNVDRRRVGVILGNIALPTEKAAALAWEILGGTLVERVMRNPTPQPPPLRGEGEPEVPCSPSPRRGGGWGVGFELNRHVAGLPAGLLARALGLGGGCVTLDAACASSLYAVKLAADELLAGRADAMLAGGVSRPDCLYTQMGFSQLRALSPSGRASPFDARGDGLVVGEGAGVFVLKRLADAQRDGDHIYAVIAGAGLSNDVGGGLLAPNSEGQLRAMRAAYRQAGWRPEDVDLIECHATGTPVGDAVEFASLRTLWEESAWRPGQCVIGSVKSTTGHLLTAAGAAGLVKVLLALRDGTLPPTANFERPASGVGLQGSPFRILKEPEPWRRRGDGVPRRAAISGFGFGGINAHLLLEEWAAGEPPGLSRRPKTAGIKPAARPDEEPIAVIAAAARVGPWDSLRAVQERLFGGRDADPQPPRRWWGVPESDWFRAAGLTPEQFAGFYLDSLNVPADRFRIPPRELAEMLPQQLLMLQVAADALAAVALPDGPRERIGAFLGIVLDLNTTHFHLRWALPAGLRSLRDAASPALNANRTMGALGSIAASRIAREFRFGGPSFTLCGEDGGGLRAVEMAVRALRRGDVDVALAGAVDLAGDVRNVLPQPRRDGAAVSEGAAAVVLKRLADAERDGDAILAVVRGVGVASADEERLARERAFAETDVAPESVGYGATPADVAERFGHAGAASGLLGFVAACLALDRRTLPGPDGPSHWLHDHVARPRRASASAHGLDGGCVHVVLEEHSSADVDSPERLQPLPEPAEALFAVEGDDGSALLEGLERLIAHAEPDVSITELARRWHAVQAVPEARRAVVVVARDRAELASLADEARRALAQDADRPLPLVQPGLARDRLFYSPQPLGHEGRIAFVYPGSGNDFPGMGRDLAARWPSVLRRQDGENRRLRSQYRPEGAATVRDRIFAQVALGTLVTDLLTTFGVRPEAALGYSLGESAALFALRAWRDRDEMLARMEASPLFVSDLTGPCDAARAAWYLPPSEEVDWVAGIVPVFPDTVRSLVAAVPRVYLLIVNAPQECVIGGQRQAVEQVATLLGCPFLPLANTTTVHCAALRPVAEAYRELHRLPTTPPPGVRVYSTALGRSYELNEDSAAEAILAQALDTIDFPAVVEQAYHDGVRLFVEIGPGASCSRMIGSILGSRPHRARSVCVAGEDGVSSLLRVLAMLCAERVPFDRDALFQQVPQQAPRSGKMITVPVGGDPFDVPPPPRQEPGASATPIRPGVNAGPTPADLGVGPAFMPGQGPAPVPPQHMTPALKKTIEVESARADAHIAFLRLSADAQRRAADLLAFQTTLLEALVRQGDGDNLSPPPPPLRGEGEPEGLAPPFPPREGGRGGLGLDRAQCLEFAVGSIGRVLGPSFGDVDALPTRVRLPDEPLMLVDRILTVEGEPLSLTSGRVVTEHDILPDAWYLDGGRIPTCIAVESGQADLFLSGYLGIDLRTRGLAVYRLLDAIVTFHRGLPGPGETIRYDIHIDRFFRQGETHLFRFRFVGSVGGETLLTMTDGCAGFFGPAELAAGKGVVQTELDRRPGQGVVPDDEGLPPQEVTSFDDGQIEALRDGDLAAAFGPAFAGMTLGRGLRLPSGRMRLVHRVPHLDPHGGRFGVGLIRGEADIHPDDWFLTCHFIDDQVMPGTLMYECCLHTLRVGLLRLGWVSQRDDVACEPVPGVASRLRCRGQVTATTRKVTYELTIKERGYGPEPYVLADALMYADGKPVVECANMSLRLVGLTREELRETWRRLSPGSRVRSPGALIESSSGLENREHGLPLSPLGDSLKAPGECTHEPGVDRRAARVLYDRDRILAFAVGKPSEAYGEPYRVFDDERRIARLPGPPFSFLDRITDVKGRPFEMVAGAETVAEYDVPADAWYFAAERHRLMPFSVLLETALQPCGWLAAFVGSALTSPVDLRFRNLGGTAVQLAPITPHTGTLTTRVRLTRVSTSGGMIIQNFDFEMRDARQVVYKGDTVFGFFSADALAQQVGIRDAQVYEPTEDERRRGQALDFPRQAPFPDDMLRMVDRLELLVPDGGPKGLGLAVGGKRVVAGEWFFAAHFYQDPVQPGSLGLEAFIQLLKALAHARWPDRSRNGFLPMLGPPHRWTYRGQVVPSNKVVTTQAVVTDVDDAAGRLWADGWLLVDGKPIYRMNDFTLSVAPGM